MHLLTSMMTSWTFFHKDHLNSIEAISRQDGTIIDTGEYLPYGQDRNTNVLLQTSSYKFTDQEQDDGTGLYNYDARFYDPEIGQFIMADAIIPQPFNPQSLNRYAYCLNNPVRYQDPSGHYATQADAVEDTYDCDAGRPQNEWSTQPGDHFDDAEEHDGYYTAVRHHGNSIFSKTSTSVISTDGSWGVTLSGSQGTMNLSGLVDGLNTYAKAGVDPEGLQAIANAYQDYQALNHGYRRPKLVDAAGISIDFSNINPFTSDTGGVYGINLEWTRFNGLHVYGYYTPEEQGSDGLDWGLSLTFNFARGSGSWEGPFDSYAGAYGVFTAGFFHSPLEGKDIGYFGCQGGFSVGTPALARTRTEYKQLFK